MVTNSMVTHWSNRVIARHRAADPTYRYVKYESCGVGLMIRRDGLGTVSQHLAVDLTNFTSPVLRIVDWSVGWVPVLSMTNM